MKFAAMKFYLPWNVNKSQSTESHWRATDGMPYIDAAGQFCPREELVKAMVMIQLTGPSGLGNRLVH
jgi:hypothetical protein